MTVGQQGQLKQGRRRKSGARNRKKRPLAAHKAFPLLLGAWGALLGGLTTMAVAPEVFERATRGTLIATLGIPSQPALAVFLATVLGTAMLGLAGALHGRARKRVRGAMLAEHAARRVRPIDPKRDLGSKSLDDPIETMPFATPAWRDADLEPDEPLPATVAATAAAAAAVPDAAPAPRDLDLDEFGRMPGRNGVWVEEPAAPAAPAPAAPAPAPVPPAAPAAAPAPRPAASRSDRAFVGALRAVLPEAPRPAPGTAALSRLRALPPSELSLLEMVERFAGALHEHRAATPARALDAAELAAREAALAEALKALAALSADTAARGVAARAEEPARTAPGGLQAQRRMERGAA